MDTNDARWTEEERLSVHLTEGDRSGHRMLAARIVEEAHAAGLAGATAWRGFLSVGPAGHVHDSRVLDLSTDLPVVVEVIDAAERIDAFAARVEELAREAGAGCLLVREPVLARRIPRGGKS